MRRKEFTHRGILLTFTMLVAGCGTDGAASNAGGSGGNRGAGGFAGASASGGSSGAAAVDASSFDAAGDSGCGDLNQECCTNLICNSGLLCMVAGVFPTTALSRCLQCGGRNGPCCTVGPDCAPGLVCRQTLDTGNRFCTDVPQPDGSTCIASCDQPGGQYCNNIGDNCGRFLDCGSCRQPGFFCGAIGIVGVCGAPRDSGACRPTVCATVAGQYCGVIGDGCGGVIDCGSCSDGSACGGSGISNLCGAPPDRDCRPSGCSSGATIYCGQIGDGCGRTVGCGTCQGGQVCGEMAENVCGSSCPLCPQCDGGPLTTVSGVAVTGALTKPDPLDGALIYVPNPAAGAKLPSLTDGPSCRPCWPGVADGVLAAAVTGPDGRFTLPNVPAGTGIPLVVQLGRWRRQTKIDVAPCVDNVLPAGLARLPRNQAEGDIPLTAIATGSHDGIECLLRKLGVEDTEFTNPSGSGRIHLYRSTGAIIDEGTLDEMELKGSTLGGGQWSRYSQILLPCEGAELRETPEALANFADYVNGGGRVLATHFGYAWLFQNGAFGSIGTWTTGGTQPADPLTTDVVNSSPRGSNFAKWLANVGALSRVSPPQMQISAPSADLAALTAGADLWLSSFSPPTTQLATIHAPILSPVTCGRVVFSDFHGQSQAPPGTKFPAECDADMALSPQEKALEFMLLNLASCGGPKAPVPHLPPRGPPLPPLPPPPPPNQL